MPLVASRGFEFKSRRDLGIFTSDPDSGGGGGARKLAALRLRPCRKYSPFIRSNGIKTRQTYSKTYRVGVIVPAGQGTREQTVTYPLGRKS